ncbi:hypothetical protein [Metasolibacillus sp.]|uniref:hypothetical protein n=1 Tax=Metasolibacillus sp. TaxID=2703680 RepID=UPI0025F39C93|nr:hypothetical protein [Metasolibacillus sp.]MCT6925386.1 hypothetical protein [Metasolibacillus sp.]MCT6941586.1 hypothetical protein [Metasolibacillus sp.]
MPNRQKRMEILDRINTLLKLCDCMSAIEYAKCEVCKELQKCGLELLSLTKEKTKTTFTKDKIITKSFVVTKSDYIEFLRKGRTRKSLAIEFNTTIEKLRTWERKNGIKNLQSYRNNLDVPNFLRLKAQKLTDKKIAKMYNIPLYEVLNIKKACGYNERKQAHITIEQYKTYQDEKMSDKAIAKKHGISVATLWRWKKENLVR